MTIDRADEHITSGPLPDPLKSAVAHDLIWFHRFRSGAMGFRASSPEPSSHSSDMTTRTTRPSSHLVAVRKERRIRVGLDQLTAEQNERLRVAYEAKQRTATVEYPGENGVHDLRDVLGVFADLALQLPGAVGAYESFRHRFWIGRARAWLKTIAANGLDARIGALYLELKADPCRLTWQDVYDRLWQLELGDLADRIQASKPSSIPKIEPWTIDAWAVIVSRDPGQMRELEPVRDAVLLAIGSDLRAYQAVWRPPLAEEVSEESARVACRPLYELRRAVREAAEEAEALAMFTPEGFRP